MRDQPSSLLTSFARKLADSRPGLVEALRSLRVGARAPFRAPSPPLAGGYLPFIGYALHYGLRGPELLRDLQRQHGDVFTLRMLGKHITFCLGREAVEHLYEAPYEEVSFLDGLKLFPGFGTVIRFNATGPEEANVGLDTLRRYLAPRVTDSTAELDREVRAALAKLAQSGRLELRTDLSSAIVQLSSYLLMGPRVARDPAFLATALEFDVATQGMVTALVSSGPLARAAASRNRLERHLLDELSSRRAAPGADRGDFIDAILAARAPDGRPFSDSQIVSDLIGYTFATTANTPAAATMCLIHILRDRVLRARVESELRAVCAQNGDLLDTASLKRLPLLEACLNETLRAYAPGIHLRSLRREARVGDYLLPVNALVAVSPYVLHHDPSLYSEPEIFDADRFLGGPRSPAKKPAALQFVPFGRGLHACVGRTLARAEVMLTVARVLTDLQPQLESSSTPFAINWSTAGLGVPKQPVHIQVKRVPS